MSKLMTLSAAALLIGSIGYATAQTSKSGAPDAGAKCWDAATNSVRDKNPQTGTAAAGKDAKTTGSSTSGIAPNSGSKTGSGSGGSTMGQRPAGMENC